VAAVRGPVKIATAGVTGTTIAAAQLGGSDTLYVLGDLTVSNTVSATALNVFGDVTAADTAVITGAVNATGAVAFKGTTAQNALTGLTAGSVDSAVAIAPASNGNIDVKGELKTTGTGSHVTLAGTGKLTAGSLNLAGNLAIGTATTGAVTVNGPAKIGGTLSNGTGASVVAFNGDTTITGAVTPSSSDLTIAGTGEVTLVAAPILTSGSLIVTNMTGVTIPSATIPNGESINASAGKVIFGTAANSVTIVKGTLASVGGLASVAANGAVALAFSSTGATLTLEGGGTIEIAGEGSVTSPGLKIAGNGTTVTGIGATGKSPIIAAGNGTTTMTINTSNGGAAGNGLIIGTAADGIQLLAVAADEMVYNFTATAGDSSDAAPVSISGAYITAPAGVTASASSGAIIAATTQDKARIVLGTASGGIKLGQGAQGGQFTIGHSNGGNKIGPFASTSTAGYLDTDVGVTGTAGQPAAKVLLGTFSNQDPDKYFCTTAGAITVIGASGSGEAEINSSLALVTGP
jgi:hypothetical protein